MARSFNGSSDSIDTGNNAVDQPTAGITVSCWVKFASLASAYSAVVSCNGTTSAYQLFVKSNGTLAVYVVINGGLVDYDGTGSHTLTTGNWYHLAFSYSSAAGLVGYVNGASDGTFAGGTTMISPNATLTFGKDAVNAGRFVNGSMADVAIYNVALSAGEILSLSGGSRPNRIRPNALVGFWPLDGLSSPEPDLSGNAKNGTLTGTAAASGPPTTLFTQKWARTDGVGGGGGAVARMQLSLMGVG